MIKLKDLLTEGKISSDVERAARKLGIKFKKDTKVVTTNKFSNPTGDMKNFGKDHERVKSDDWMDRNPPSNWEELGDKLVKMLKSKYKVLKAQEFASGKSVRFINRKKDPRSEFTIGYAKSIAGAYISYDGLEGE